MSIRLTSRYSKAVSAFLGVVLSFDAAYAASNWGVTLASGTKGGETEAASVQQISIDAEASQTLGNLLYPGGTGDVELHITNPNPFPVTITGIQLPTSTTFASGYTTSALSTAQTGCDSTTSYVSWTGATTTSGSPHTLATPLVVAANNSSSPLVVTLTNAATMGSNAAAACEATWFAMPTLVGVTASGAAATATTGPATDSYS